MDTIFFSSFIIKCKLKENFNLNNLKSIFEGFPALKLVTYGTNLKYVINENKNSSRNASTKTLNIKNTEIEFYKDKIIYKFYFTYPDKQIYNHNLLKFISILAIVDNYYIIQLDPLYYYIIKVLYEFSNNFKIDRPKDKILNSNYDQIIKDVNNTNLLLSKEIIELNNAINKIKADLTSYGLFIVDLIEKVLHENIKNKDSIIFTLNEFGIDQILINKVIENIENKNIGTYE